MDEGGAEVRLQRVGIVFYLLQNIHTGSGNHPDFYSMGTGKLFNRQTAKA
jgi:hypothetical protein